EGGPLLWGAVGRWFALGGVVALIRGTTVRGLFVGRAVRRLRRLVGRPAAGLLLITRISHETRPYRLVCGHQKCYLKRKSCVHQGPPWPYSTPIPTAFRLQLRMLARWPGLFIQPWTTAWAV